MTHSIFLEGLESARRIVVEKGINALDDLISELKTNERETAIAEHPSTLETRTINVVAGGKIQTGTETR